MFVSGQQQQQQQRRQRESGGGMASAGGKRRPPVKKGVNGVSSPRSNRRGRLRLDCHDEDEYSSYSSSSSSEEEEDDRRGDRDEEGGESVDAKRLRLAREYLRRVEEGDGSSSSSSSSGSDEDDGDAVGRRLARTRLKIQGTHDQFGLAERIRKRLDSLRIRFSPEEASAEVDAEAEARCWLRRNPDNPDGPVRYLRGHTATPTCVALGGGGGGSSGGGTVLAYSGSKDGSVLAYDVDGERTIGAVMPRWDDSSDGRWSSNNSHEREVLAISASDDGRYLASGGRDGTVRVFDVRTTAGITRKNGGAEVVAKFRGHKGPVTCLAFRSNSLQLFSGSEDRCIRHYNLEEMAYVETLYGHQAAVTCIDCHRAGRPISTGRDRTARAWKVMEESHLIYRGGSRALPADCVAVVSDGWFVTGHEDGALNLWQTEKKRAVSTVEAAHHRLGRGGFAFSSSPSSSSTKTTCMIASCDALKGSDMVATGSNDGYLRFWRVRTGKTDDDRGLDAVGNVPVHGYVNGIAIGPGGRFCALAVGREHRLGRWEQVPRARDRFAILRLGGGDDGDHRGGPLDAAENVSLDVDGEGVVGGVKDDTKPRINGVTLQRRNRSDSSGDDSCSEEGTQQTKSSSSDDESSDSERKSS